MPRLHFPKFRFTLRTFLIVCILPVPVLAWLAHVKKTAARQREAIAQLESQGLVHVMRQRATPFLLTNIIRTYIDQDAFDTANRVYLNDLGGMFARKTWKRDDIEAFAHLKGLRVLSLTRPSQTATVDYRPDRIDLPAKVLTKLSKIQTLASLSIDAEFDPETQLMLARLPVLDSLHLPGTQATNEMLQALGQSEKISSIDIDASLLSAKGLEGLRHAPVLQKLMLRQLPGNLQLLGALAKCRALTHLQLHSCSLAAEDAKFINALPIQSLSLFHCEIEPGFLTSLKSSRTLNKLQITAKRDDGLNNHFDGNLDKLAACEDRFAVKVQAKSPTD